MYSKSLKVPYSDFFPLILKLLLSMNVENPSSDQNCVLKGLLQGVFHIHTPGPGRSVSVPGMVIPHHIKLYMQGNLASQTVLQ